MVKKKKSDVTFKDFEDYIVRTPDYIRWGDLEKIMGRRMYRKFRNFMTGQTCLVEGAYPCDVANFFQDPKYRFFD
jgi:hypothetical protein